MVFIACGHSKPRRLATKAGGIHSGLIHCNGGVPLTSMDPSGGPCRHKPGLLESVPKIRVILRQLGCITDPGAKIPRRCAQSMMGFAIRGL